MKPSEQNIANFIGKLMSFNSSLKLYHWHVSGENSYSQHMALDQALEGLTEATDSIAETQYALKGDLFITIPQTDLPTNIIKHVEDFYVFLNSQRDIFSESFTQGTIDGIQETLQQLLYRLKRLK